MRGERIILKTHIGARPSIRFNTLLCAILVTGCVSSDSSSLKFNSSFAEPLDRSVCTADCRSLRKEILSINSRRDAALTSAVAGAVAGALAGFLISDKPSGALVGAVAGALLGATVGSLVYSDDELDDAQASKLVSKVNERASEDLLAVETSLRLLREIERDRELIVDKAERAVRVGQRTKKSFASTLAASAALTAEEVAFVEQNILIGSKKSSKIYDDALRKAGRTAKDRQRLREARKILRLNRSALSNLSVALKSLADQSVKYRLRADACSGAEDTSDPGPSCYVGVN